LVEAQSPEHLYNIISGCSSQSYDNWREAAALMATCGLNESALSYSLIAAAAAVREGKGALSGQLVHALNIWERLGKARAVLLLWPSHAWPTVFLALLHSGGLGTVQHGHAYSACLQLRERVGREALHVADPTIVALLEVCGKSFEALERAETAQTLGGYKGAQAKTQEERDTVYRLAAAQFALALAGFCDARLDDWGFTEAVKSIFSARK